MKFKYKKYGNVLRPVIPIKVLSSNNPEGFGYEVLVDSGADLCIFHAEIGEALGLNIKKGKSKAVFGVGGKASIYFMHHITISIGGWYYDIEAGFMPDVSGKIMPFGLVGQRGFFENFVVKFDLSKSEIELKRK